MGTKNLARTVIEGGRYRRNKWERRYSHKEERSFVRDFCKKVQTDPELSETAGIKPRKKVYKGFRDKLGPMYRWLRSQVGKPWNEVRSLVAQNFDTRTTAGRHITYDHLLSSVELSPDLGSWRYNPVDPFSSRYKNDYYVDDKGLLQKKRYIGRRRASWALPIFNGKRLCNWLQGRIVVPVGDKLFWFNPADRSKKWWRPAYHWKCELDSNRWRAEIKFMYLTETPVYLYDETGRKVKGEDGFPIVLEHKKSWIYGYPFGFRQGKMLKSADLEYWNTVPE
jgi:hypothetical protein